MNPTPAETKKLRFMCGFRHLGEVIDPKDGRVWRWEKAHA